MHTTELYFESHITIEPVFDDKLDRAGAIAEAHGFRLANLLMQKRSFDTPERSKHDTFMTAQGGDYGVLFALTLQTVRTLQEANFKIWRIKLENTLFDTRYNGHEGVPSDLKRSFMEERENALKWWRGLLTSDKIRVWKSSEKSSTPFEWFENSSSYIHKVYLKEKDGH